MSLPNRSLARLKTQGSWQSTALTGLAAASFLPFAPSNLDPVRAYVNTYPRYHIQIVSSAVSHVTKLEIKFEKIKLAYKPRTELGKKLLGLRNKAINNGMRLLSADEVTEEIQRRRGEIV